MTALGWSALSAVTLAVSLMLGGAAIGECELLALAGLVFALLNIGQVLQAPGAPRTRRSPVDAEDEQQVGIVRFIRDSRR